MQIINSLEYSPPGLDDGLPLFKLLDERSDFKSYGENIPEKQRILLTHFIKKHGLDNGEITRDSLSRMVYSDEYLEQFTQKKIYEEKISAMHQLLLECDEDLWKYFDVNVSVKDEVILEESLDSETMVQLNLYNQKYVEFLVDKYRSQHTAYRQLCQDMKKCLEWFESQKKQSNCHLQKYRVVFGLTSEEWVGERKNAEKFVVGGMCYYNKYIYINTYHDGPVTYREWDRFSLRHMFFHEVGHAVSHSKQSILKNHERGELCKNPEFIKVVKTIWKNVNFRFFKYKNRSNTLYYFMPHKKNWSRPCEETFSETFAYVMQYFHSGFSPLHFYLLDNKNHYRAINLLSFKPAIEWMLDNMDLTLFFPKEKQLRTKIREFKNYLNQLSKPTQLYQFRNFDLRSRKYSPKYRKNKLLKKR